MNIFRNGITGPFLKTTKTHKLFILCSLEPIRADSLILEQSEDLVLHLEFQTEPNENMGFRMLDYRIRVYRRFPSKTMHQFVIYLKPTKSTLVYQDSFQLGETIHRYRVIRLWQQSSEIFLRSLVQGG
jgi:predicted transposase/invertase (TIGR01784 family)